ncbi:YheT family hydrolase [Dyadobacter subterraneus]|uniref:Alpha/beta fold hydrolase n=1 Tax=Dyadobacter subterraneus TaxID=2773304 RepID=A0ABR9W5E9_9BACT|nr:alpha/beta fold hydrolase [Dyadobacter subterraneus]MBE9460676.1 alpha/beta fold hydrolase [Dyadobacter subterraneus]
MPVVRSSNHNPPFWLPNGHLQTIYPALFRTINSVDYQRERIVTPDHDFLDLDWSLAVNKQDFEGKNNLVILSHGLEGNSTRQYILGMVRFLNAEGYDCLAWNFRSCSGEMNKTSRFYHSGATEDLDLVIRYALEKGYSNIDLVGFSLGGNLTLKYLGEENIKIDPRIKKAVVFSVPMDLKACSLEIVKPQNRIYQSRFLNTLKPKVDQKAVYFPGDINSSDFKFVNTLYDFDDIFTAPLHGFQNADHYYEMCSAKFFVKNITIPTLIVNAANDPIVPENSLPVELIDTFPNVLLEISAFGGHCGFRPSGLFQTNYWSELRALEFLGSQMLL